MKQNQTIRRMALAATLVAILLPLQACASPPAAHACADLTAELNKIKYATAKGPAYAELADLAEKRSCLFMAARAHAGRASTRLKESRLALAQRHIERARELLAAWRNDQGAEEPQSPAAKADLEAAIELHALDWLFRLGLLEEARLKHQEVRALHKKFKANPEQQVAREVHGSRVLRRLGKLREAKSALLSVQRYLGDATPNNKSGWFEERAWIAMELGDLDAARKDLAEALVHCDGDDFRAHILGDFVELALRENDGEEAQRLVQEAFELASGSKGLHLNAHLRHLRARVFDQLGDLDNARQMADRALELLDANRNAWSVLGLAYFANREQYFKHRLDLAFSSQDPGEMWRVFEAWQARVLLHSLEGIDETEVLSQTVLIQQREFRARLREAVWDVEQWEPTSGSANLQRLQAAYLNALSDLRDVQAGIALELGQRPAPRSVSKAEAAGLLGKDTLGLTFLVGSGGMMRLALEPEGRLTSRALNLDLEGIGRLVEQLTVAWQGQQSPQAEIFARRLSELLFAGLEDLERFDRLAIVASGPLEGLPLDALPHPAGDSPLIMSHQTVYLPSFSVLGALRTTRACQAPSGKILALGDPVFDPEDERWPPALRSTRSENDTFGLGRLEASGLEVASLKELYGSAATVLRGSSATRQNFIEQAPRYALLHLATHAMTDIKQPDRSRLALSCVDERNRAIENCDLFLRDISELELCAQTVVLSACSSADGRRVAGEGVLGLPRAFLEVGARTIVATAWDIDDLAASELMQSFHLYVASGIEVSEALRRTRKGFAANGKPIHMWAPFMVIGDWQSAPLP